MAGETSLRTPLRTLTPELNPGDYVALYLRRWRAAERRRAARQLPRARGPDPGARTPQAERLGLPHEYVAAWITLTVHSSLAAVGLTAAFATALAEAGSVAT